MLQLGLPNMMMVVAEWGCFEVVALWVGLLGELSLKAYVVIMNINALVFMVALALGVSGAPHSFASV